MGCGCPRAGGLFLALSVPPNHRRLRPWPHRALWGQWRLGMGFETPMFLHQKSCFDKFIFPTVSPLLYITLVYYYAFLWFAFSALISITVPFCLCSHFNNSKEFTKKQHSIPGPSLCQVITFAIRPCTQSHPEHHLSFGLDPPSMINSFF